MEGCSDTHLTVIDNMCILFTGYVNYGPDMQISDQCFLVYQSGRGLVHIGPQSPLLGSCGEGLQKLPGLLVPCCAIHPADTAIKSPIRTNTVNVRFIPSLCKRPHLLPHQMVCSRHPPQYFPPWSAH